MLDTRLRRSDTSEPILPPGVELNHPLWKRLMVAAVVLSIGTTAIAIGASSIGYRLTHLTVTNSFVNGRMARLRVPVDGKIKAFYARPGVTVKSGQVVARIAPTPQAQQNLLHLQGEVDTTLAQLAAGRQSLALLNQQLSSLENQDQALRTTNVSIADKEVSHNQAVVTEATAKAQAARSEYDRYRQLLADGAISKQKVDELQAIWKSADAEVKQAEANLSSARTSLKAFKNGVAVKPGATLDDERRTLTQAIQTQTALVQTLEAELATKKQSLAQARTIYSSQKDVEVKAPFAGVVYRTEREQGEQVNRPDNLLTLLDCNDLWVETLVSADQANRIDVQKPVRVQLAGETTTLIGQVDLIEAVNSVEMLREQVQAITPPISADLVGKPLARVTVRIPPSTQQSKAHQFCGIGQTTSMTFGTKLLGR